MHDDNCKEYAVVKILEDGGTCYSEIPSNWLVQVNNEYTQCWWPNAECSSQLIINRENPNPESWHLIDIELEKFWFIIW